MLVKVLSRPSRERGFRHLLTLSNLREVFDHPEEFILSKVQRLNFEGSGDVRAKERVQNRLLTRIKEPSDKMAGGDPSDAFPFVALPSRPSLSSRSKRLREGEAETLPELWQRVHNQRAQQVEERSSNPRLREGAQDANAPPKDRRPPSCPQGGIRILEGHETRLARGNATTSKGKGNVVASLENTLSGEKPLSPPFPQSTYV